MISRRTLWVMLAVGVLSLALLMRAAGLVIDPRTPGAAAYALLFSTLAAVRWTFRRPQTQLRRAARDMAEYCGVFMAISLVGALASYPVAALSHGFADGMLQRSDAALHFNWLAWYKTVAAHPLLQMCSRSAYAMIYISPAVLLGWLSWTDQRREAHDFTAAVGISAGVTLIGFYFMPAVGPFSYLWHGPFVYLPVSDLWQPQLIPQLRAHLVHEIDLGHLVGLVSAPSFHAAAAVLLITFSARQPRIRIPLIAINVAMLLATPVEGTHYLTDMLMGALVAGGSIGALRLIRSSVCHVAEPGGVVSGPPAGGSVPPHETVQAMTRR